MMRPCKPHTLVDSSLLKWMGCFLFLIFSMPPSHGMPLQPSSQFDTHNCLSQTNDNRPQWQDVGLQDLLVTIGQPTVPTPSQVRPSHDYAAPFFGQSLSHQFKSVRSKTNVPAEREPKGSLYLWHFLRL